MDTDFFAAWRPRALALLRIVAAFLFVLHGAQKLLDFPAAPSRPFVFWSLPGVVAPLELIGGLLLLFGLFTRPVAFLFSGEMAVAYFIVHAPRGFWPLLNGGELPVLFCFVFLYLAAAGGGPWSLDHLWGRRKQFDTANGK